MDLMLDVFQLKVLKAEVPKFIHYLMPLTPCQKQEAGRQSPPLAVE